MTGYLLDTCIVVFLFRDKYNVATKLDEIGLQNCYISEITIAELQAGVEKSSSRQFNQMILDKFVQMVNVVPFSSVIKRYAKEKVATERQGTPVADFDLLIGCSALENDLIMVTDNVKHFSSIPGIVIENWIDRQP